MTFSRIKRLAVLSVVAATLSACGAAERLENIGKAPEMSPITNPTQRTDYRRVSMPMPTPQTPVREPNSLWKAGARAFFDDQRAKQVGDILTVVVTIEDKAQLSNRTSRSRQSSESNALTNLLGFESKLSTVLPNAVDKDNLVDLNTDMSNVGEGGVTRGEVVELRVAAVVTQVLPNGNLVISGHQEVRVNFEVREIVIGGVVRPEDIQGDNTIPHDKIAEARIAYGGRGQITDVQQPRYGSQVLDVILPF